LIGILSTSIVYIFLLFWKKDQDSWYLFGVCGILLGIGDGVWVTQIPAIMGTFFQDRLEAAFAATGLVTSAATALAFLGHGIGFENETIIFIIMNILGFGCLLFEDHYLTNLDTGITVGYFRVSRTSPN